MSKVVSHSSDPLVEETVALAVHLFGYGLGLVEQVLPGHAASARLRDAIDALGVGPGFRCDGCGQIRPAEDFNRFRARGAERQQPCAACCTARSQRWLVSRTQGSG